ncbi:hypothetical protein T459_04140 [Capsicum annuum]|uniref:Uncharacterized protein n=1 Tax=Capsicum annuum TaxID=4072 RepID=A0A2G3A461_CAPAN|nr:hypothetical protein T459_04140 [Capsicum annuum]
MIGKADIEGSKSNVAMNAWFPQASYHCGHLHYLLTNVYPQPNSPPDNVFCSDQLVDQIPLVRTTFELVVRRMGKAPEGTVPSSSPIRYAVTRFSHGSSFNSPSTADKFGTWNPVPSPQSQSFSQSYGSILPTSITYIIPSTRGCSPWRPDTVMTIEFGSHMVLVRFDVSRKVFENIPMLGTGEKTKQNFVVIQNSLGMLTWEEGDNSYDNVWVMDDEDG